MPKRATTREERRLYVVKRRKTSIERHGACRESGSRGFQDDSQRASEFSRVTSIRPVIRKDGRKLQFELFLLVSSSDNEIDPSRGAAFRWFNGIAFYTGFNYSSTMGGWLPR